LNPEVDRLALSCEMKVDDKGKIIDYEVYESVIKSRKKMTYDAVNQILEENTIPLGYEDYADTLIKMNELAIKVQKLMKKRGYIEFDRPEIKVIMDEVTNKPIDIQKRVQRSGEKLIETFMIMANETILTYLTNVFGIGIYRVHDVPNQEKIESLFGFIALRGGVLSGKINKKHITPSSLNDVLEQLNNDPAVNVIKDLMIRSMAKAYYSTVIIHILVKLSLHDYNEDEIRKWELSLEDYARQASVKERDADNVEREVTKMRVAEYMEEHIGEVYDGVISGLTDFGVFVELDNLVEGLIRYEDMTDDHYTYEPSLYATIGQRSKKRYMLGDSITIKVKGASKEKHEVDFEIYKEEKRNEKEEENKKKVKSR